ncbi:MAG: hypothetical protein ACFBSF_18735 [Leptolyngbyaceae cyanobacterium]
MNILHIGTYPSEHTPDWECQIAKDGLEHFDGRFLRSSTFGLDAIANEI